MGVGFSHAPPSGNEPQDGDVRVEGSCAKRAVAGVSRVQHQRVHQELKDVDVPVLGGPAKRVVAVVAGVGRVQPKFLFLSPHIYVLTRNHPYLPRPTVLHPLRFTPLCLILLCHNPNLLHPALRHPAGQWTLEVSGYSFAQLCFRHTLLHVTLPHSSSSCPHSAFTTLCLTTLYFILLYLNQLFFTALYSTQIIFLKMCR